MKLDTFSNDVFVENDSEGFICPYKLQGKVDYEIMFDKYMKLRKNSYGLIVRLGIPPKQF